MNSCTAAMPSYTYVMKGEKLLRSRGIRCEIRRNERISESGCGYSLHIAERCTDAVRILKYYSIPCSISSSEGV